MPMTAKEKRALRALAPMAAELVAEGVNLDSIEKAMLDGMAKEAALAIIRIFQAGRRTETWAPSPDAEPCKYCQRLLEPRQLCVCDGALAAITRRERAADADGVIALGLPS